MANCMKVNRMGVGHLFAHYERRDGVQFGNQEIDTSKSDLNYNLVPERFNDDGSKMTQHQFLEKRMKELHFTNKKDLNVMCSWVVTLPDNITDENEKKKFFEESFNFLCQRYGKENVISSYVHYDETTPHMHFAFIPVVEHMKRKVYGKDEYVYEDTLNAKKVISRTELQKFHPDFNSYMAKQFGRDLGLVQYVIDPTTGEQISLTKANGNKTIKQLKKEKALLSNAVDKLNNNYSILQNNVGILKVQQQQLENENNKIKNEKNTTINDLNKLNIEKNAALLTKTNLENDIKTLETEFDNIKNADISVTEKESYIDNLHSDIYANILEVRNAMNLTGKTTSGKEFDIDHALNDITHFPKFITKWITNVKNAINKLVELVDKFSKATDINNPNSDLNKLYKLQVKQKESKLNIERVIKNHENERED